MAELGLGLLEARLGAQALRLQRRDLPLYESQVFQCCPHRRFLLLQLRRVLLGILNGAPAVLRPFPVAARLLLCEDERCLRAINLCLVGADLRLLDGDLRVDVLHARLGLLHRGLGLADGDRVIGRVDDHQQIALVHVLVVDDWQLDDAPGDLRRHRDDVGAHGAVTRPRCAHIRIPHRPPEHDGDRHDERGEQHRHHTPRSARCHAGKRVGGPGGLAIGASRVRFHPSFDFGHIGDFRHGGLTVLRSKRSTTGRSCKPQT